MDHQFIVICRADRNPWMPDVPGRYELATREVFTNEYRAELYWQGISSSREPMIVRGDFEHLRFPIALECGGVRFEERIRIPTAF